MRTPALFLLLALLPLAARAQYYTPCRVQIAVADTHYLADSVRYTLVAPADADSVWWHPAALFVDSTARSQVVTLGCGDTARVALTVCYRNTNLLRWREPGHLQSHTSYTYLNTLADGDLCRPRTLAMDADPADFCTELPGSYPRSGIVIRSDTLRCYGDSLPAFFPFDSNRRTDYLTMALPHIRQVPYNSAFVPFYTDTVDLWNPSRTRTFVLRINRSRVYYDEDTLSALPGIIVAVHIDDTARIFFAEGHNVPLRDTTLIFLPSLEFPRPGVAPSQAQQSDYYFNSVPRPHGRAVFRFYETPTIYYNTLAYTNINRIELLGDCRPTDSLLLTAPPCGCTVHDTLWHTVCRSQLPYLWDTLLFRRDSTSVTTVHAFPCDTVRVRILAVRDNDTILRHDTIVQNALPWTAFGHTFDTAGRYTLVLPGLPPQCDTLVHYQLMVIPNVADTTHSYICPGQLPYTEAGVTVWGDTVFNTVLPGSRGQDSTVTHFIHLKHDSDTALFDTIVESQLPWPFMDSLFTDSVEGRPFVITNEEGCDSIIRYSLFVYWDGDHCDSSLSFPNIITPNADGFNDRFIIGGLVEEQCYPYNELTIVDRTGRVVFRATNICRPDQWWDPAADRSPAGTYFYRFVGHGIHHATQHQGCIELLK